MTIADAFRWLGLVLLVTLTATAVLTAEGWAANTQPIVLPAERNPGALRALLYVPPNAPVQAPLIVAMHGCGQSAESYFQGGRWKSFADQHGFLVLLPEQPERMRWKLVPEWFRWVPINNGAGCFNFGDAYHSERDRGEARSIAELVKEVHNRRATDPARTFVTGLSAGGGMTAVMMATYPELFAGGAIIEGLPYRCADTTLSAYIHCGIQLDGQVTKAHVKDRTPTEWAALVRKAGDAASHPLVVSIWRGLDDKRVDPAAGVELLDQWSEVLGVDRTADVVDDDTQHPQFVRRVYRDAEGRDRIETYELPNFGHALPVDADASFEPCGTETGAWPYVADGDICSTARILSFWGIGRQ